MLRRAVIILALICGFFRTTSASDNEVETELTTQYRDRILALRHSFKSASQEYQADGTPVQAGEEGPWTLYGRIGVKKIGVVDRKIQLEGIRIVYMFDPIEKRFMPFKSRELAKITIRLNVPLTSTAQGGAVLDRVFAIRQEDIVKSAPAYWQPYLAKELSIEAGKKEDSRVEKNGEPKSSPGNGDAKLDKAPTLADLMVGIEVPKKVDPQHAASVGGEKVFHVGPGVTAPRILYKLEPEFTEAARRAGFQGTLGMNVVVDDTGRVKNVVLVHPLGMGLDESAVSTVSTWRFKPATKDGHPVAVAVYIEVSFHLGL